jgi:LuxR family maltose regulon positive regulatory protein
VLLAEDLSLARPEGWLQVFVDQGAPLAALLRRLAVAAAKSQPVAAAPPPGPYLDRLLQAFGQAGLPVLPRPRRGGAVPGGLVLPLSARELEVLRLLAAGRSNQDIAEALVVTRARELGLLP